MKLKGIDLAIAAVILLCLAGLIIRIVWLANTNWGQLLTSMTATDWAMSAIASALLIWLRLKK